MVTGVVAACAVVAVVVLVLLAARRTRVRSDRRVDSLLREIDGHLKAISASVGEAIDHFAEARSERAPLFLTLDFDALVDTLVAEAAARTGADAVVLRVEGPGKRPVVASLGPRVEGEELERTFGPPDARPFRSATTDWAYRATDVQDDAQPFQSALVTPLEPEAGAAGTLAVYSTAADAFRPEHAAALRGLLDEAAIGLTNARRFAEIESRTLLDPATGVPNPRGYELELGREVARAHRTGRPLSVVLVGMEAATSGRHVQPGNGVTDVARLLTRVTRKTDISCRRGEREFAILLPETRAAGATTLTSRLREEARRTLGVSRSTLTVGFVEWRPNETFEALAARADAALGRPLAALAAAPLGARPATEPTDDLRRDVLETVTREIAEARRHGHSLALAVLDIDGLDEIGERLGREAADSALAELAGRLDESVGPGSIHRLGPDEFVLVLPGSTTQDAEALLGTLQGSLEPPSDVERLTFGAGITELGDDDHAPAALERVEQALRQAKQVGHGTVVVAVPGIAAPRPR
jgi:diguanylate cyclase (GGDEF)-like protein